VEKLLAVQLIAANSPLTFRRSQPVGEPPRFLQPLFPMFLWI
jgi:hypothetical protein